MKLINELYKYAKNYKNAENSKSIFIGISGYYYHENYHSDILAYYLSNPLAKRIFIQWLNEKIPDDRSRIIIDNYIDGEVRRESGRIDITLFSNDGENAVIIENKSNNAGDQTKQVYRYYYNLIKSNIKVESIFYLNKSSIKKPDYTELSGNEIDEIDRLITIGQLCGNNSFTQKVLENVIKQTTDIRLNALSHEIKELFNYVVYGEMNMDNMDDFVSELADDNNYEKIQQIIKMYNDIPVFLANKYKNYVIEQKKNFEIKLWKPQCLVIDKIRKNEKYFAIDFWFYNTFIDISILDRHDNYELVHQLKEQMNERFIFTEFTDNRYRLKIDNILDDERIRNVINSLIDSFS